MDKTEIPGADESGTFEELAHRLEREIKARGFFSSRFQGKSTEHVIVEAADPEMEAGDMFAFNLRTEPRGRPVQGDDLAFDAEDRLATHAHSVVMGLFPQEPGYPRAKVAKPSLSDLRQCLEERHIARFADAVDAMIIKYLSGFWAFGPYIEKTVLFPPGVMIDQQYNALFLREAVASHYMFADDVYSKHSLTAENKLNKRLLDAAASRARTMTEDFPNATVLRPIRVGNSEYFVVIMHPYQARDLRRDLGDRGWSEIERNLADSEARDQPIARDALGIVDNLILYEHPSVVTFMGSEDADLPCAGALLLGCQAGMIAYGGFAKGERPAGSRTSSGDEEESPFILQQLIGFNRCRYGPEFYSCDCGVIRLDTAAYE